MINLNSHICEGVEKNFPSDHNFKFADNCYLYQYFK